MALSGIALCSRALLKLGAGGIASFNEGTAESEIAANLYPSIRDALISAYPWSFATTQVWLPQLVAEPLADYGYAYQLPADFLRALSAGSGPRSRGIEYRLQERKLHTDAPDVVLTYIFRPAESEIPAFFDQVLIARLAAEFCIPITESTTRADVLFKLSENEFSRAKMIDAQQDSPSQIEDFTLIEVRS